MEILTKRFDNVGETLQTAVLDNGLRVCVVPKKGFSSSNQRDKNTGN